MSERSFRAGVNMLVFDSDQALGFSRGAKDRSYAAQWDGRE